MLPNFFVVGAMKAGTTALYHSLRQHPEIYMSPIKETDYFALGGAMPRFNGPRDHERINKYGIYTEDEYLKLFRGLKNEKAVGEASNSYLKIKIAPFNISKRIPQAKIIAVLRNPVERAFSEYMYLLRDEYEPCENLLDAVSQEKRGERDGWWMGRYIETGKYAEQLQRYLGLFSRKKIKVYLYEDLKDDWEGILKDMFQFLNVDNRIKPIAKKINVSGVPKSEALHRLHGFLVKSHPTKSIFLKPFLPRKIRAAIRESLLNKIRNVNLRKTDIPEEVSALLKREFEDDISRLQELIQRDLSHWLS